MPARTDSASKAETTAFMAASPSWSDTGGAIVAVVADRMLAGSHDARCPAGNSLLIFLRALALEVARCQCGISPRSLARARASCVRSAKPQHGRNSPPSQNQDVAILDGTGDLLLSRQCASGEGGQIEAAPSDTWLTPNQSRSLCDLAERDAPLDGLAIRSRGNAVQLHYIRARRNTKMLRDNFGRPDDADALHSATE